MSDPDAYQPRRPRRVPVWGFPRGYNPNLMGDRCELCRNTTAWIPRVIEGQNFTAWSCRCCVMLRELPQRRRLEIPE